MSSDNRREQLRRQQEAHAKAKRTQRIVGVGAGILALALVAVFVVIFIQQANRPPVPSANTPPNVTQANDGIIVNPGKAKPGAPVVGLYTDYQCPVCKQFEDIFGSELKKLAEAGEIQLVYHTMNFMDSNLHNDSSTNAAVGATCADIAGKFSAYHDAVYASQPTQEGAGYDVEALRTTIPKQIGISGTELVAFQKCFDTKATQAFVTGVNEAAFKAGVTSTPTMMVNGKVIDNKTLPVGNPAGIRDVITTAAAG